MSNRTQLSPDTLIEGDWLMSRDDEVLSAWPDEKIADPWGTPGFWLALHRDDCRPLYEYREGEPWCGIFHGTDANGVEIDTIADFTAADTPGDVPVTLHLRSIMVCGGSADSLRAFHVWLGEGA